MFKNFEQQVINEQKAHDGLPPEVDTHTEQFDVIVAGAEWIAADLKKILSDEHRHFYAEMLRGELAKSMSAACSL